MEKLDIHRIFPHMYDIKYSLPPTKKMYLISVTPKDPDITERLRNLLKEIEVEVKFSDIYGTEYEREKKDFKIFASEFKGIKINDIEKYNLWC